MGWSTELPAEEGEWTILDALGGDDMHMFKMYHT